MTLGDCIFAIVSGWLLLMVLLQTYVGRGVWWAYTFSLPIVLILWAVWHYQYR